MSVPTRDELVEQIQKIRAQVKTIADRTDNPSIEHALRHADEQCHYALAQLAGEDSLSPEMESLRNGKIQRFNSRTRASKYWNPYLETMPREELDRYHLWRLQRIIKFAYDYSPFYRQLYDRHGVKPEDIKTLDDYVKRLPTTDKKDIVEAQLRRDVHPMWGSRFVSIHDDGNLQYYSTTGTTAGAPLLAPYEWAQFVRTGVVVEIPLWAIGVRHTDVLYFAFNFGPFMGFWCGFLASLQMNTNALSGGGFDTRTRINQIKALKPTVLFATPSYALHIAEVARQMDFDLRSSSVKYLMLSGEAGANIPATKKALEEAWGAKAYEYYGMADAGGIAGSCEIPGRMHVMEGSIYSIAVDKNGDLVRDGEVGENVVTDYYQQFVMPSIKYRTHDLVRLSSGSCECGRTWKYFDGGVLGRTDNMIIIKGTNVYPTSVEVLLDRVPGTTEHYELHVDKKDGLDNLVVKIEAASGVPRERYGEIAKGLSEVFKLNLNVTIPVEVLAPGKLPRYELKAKRFFDHRFED